VLAEAESILLRYRQLDELVGLWHGRALHAKALALLASLGQQADDAPAARPPPALVAPPALRGPAATIDYLCRLGASDLDLIFEFAQWPLRAAPTDALRIFAEPPAARGGSGGGRRGGALPAERVFDYVRAQQGRELALELVERWLAAPAAAGARATATEPAVPARLHDELASSQLQAIARLCALIVDAPADAADAAAGAEAAARAPARAGAEFQKADGALADASAPAAAEGVAQERARAAAAVASARAELAGLRARCEPFLRSSLALNADALLRALCAGASAPLLCALAPERALLLRTLGRHEAALRLLVVEMSDLSAAMVRAAPRRARAQAARRRHPRPRSPRARG
jgi:exonuclease SbcC